MGQPVSKALMARSQSEGALHKPRHHQDDCSPRSTVSSDDISQGQRRSRKVVGLSRNDRIAALQSANRFFDGSPKSVWTLNLEPEPQQPDMRASGQRQQQFRPPAVDVVIPNKVPTKPVKCPPRRREIETEQWGYHAHDGDDTDDAQYLKRLYELRTWDMYVRITEARRRQRYGATRNHVPMGNQPLMEEAVPEPSERNSSLFEGSSSHEMIFSCDLE